MFVGASLPVCVHRTGRLAICKPMKQSDRGQAPSHISGGRAGQVVLVRVGEQLETVGDAQLAVD